MIPVGVCNKWKQQLGSKLNIIKNDYNVGLVKNCLLSIERATGDYVWLVGDDDPVEVIAVQSIINVLEANKDLDILHINHRCISGIDGNIIIPSFYKVSNDLNSIGPGYKLVTELLQSQHTGGFMFITANVLNRLAAIDFISKYPPQEDTLLAYPLFLNAGLAATGRFYLISDCIIDCVYHQSSWSDKYFKVFYQEVPQTLAKLHSLGIGKSAIMRCFDYQFSSMHSLHDILDSLKKGRVSFVFSSEFRDWLKRRILKEKIKWQIQSR